MKRRHLLRTSALGLTIGLAGCQSSQKTGTTTRKDHEKVLALSPTVRKSSDGWELTVIASNEYDWDTSIYDIQVVAYATNGTKVGEAHVGDLLSSGDFQRTVEMTCSGFPAIVTATTRETPCGNASIPVLWWTGTDAQRNEIVEDGEWPWEKTYRKCSEELPPERILEKFETASTP